MGAFREICQRDQFLILKISGCLRWLPNTAFSEVEESEAVADSDSILHAAIRCIHNLLPRIRNQHCRSDARNTKAKILQSLLGQINGIDFEGGRGQEICICSNLISEEK